MRTTTKRVDLMIKHVDGMPQLCTSDGAIVANAVECSMDSGVDKPTSVTVTYYVTDDKDECGLFYRRNKS